MDKRKFSGLAGILIVIAAVWLLKGTFPVLSAALMTGGVLAAAVIAGIVIAVIIFAFKKPELQAGDLLQKELIDLQKSTRAVLIELRKSSFVLKNKEIRMRIDKICETANKILNALKENKESVLEVRGFFDYYLPVFGKILKKYEYLEKQEVTEAAITSSVIQCFEDIQKAMDHQYLKLFGRYKEDLSIEMEALTIACKREGLLADEDFAEEDDNIKLTL